ncbi:WG repeat-containing protein [Alistipes sp.]|uniref:WG repeat-containing protein n=1 Tax=Alistipes sp. TaxID=1872444 RepID=UPI0011DCD9C8
MLPLATSFVFRCIQHQSSAKYIFYTNLDLFCRVLIIFVSIKEYDNISSFHKDLIEIKLNGKWGIINSKGEIVVPAKYDKTIL